MAKEPGKENSLQKLYSSGWWKVDWKRVVRYNALHTHSFFIYKVSDTDKSDVNATLLLKRAMILAGMVLILQKLGQYLINAYSQYSLLCLCQQLRSPFACLSNIVRHYVYKPI